MFLTKNFFFFNYYLKIPIKCPVNWIFRIKFSHDLIILFAQSKIKLRLTSLEKNPCQATIEFLAAFTNKKLVLVLSALGVTCSIWIKCASLLISPRNSNILHSSVSSVRMHIPPSNSRQNAAASLYWKTCTWGTSRLLSPNPLGVICSGAAGMPSTDEPRLAARFSIELLTLTKSRLSRADAPFSFGLEFSPCQKNKANLIDYNRLKKIKKLEQALNQITVKQI